MLPLGVVARARDVTVLGHGTKRHLQFDAVTDAVELQIAGHVDPLVRRARPRCL